MSKLTSVCLCCHNRPEFLESTLRALEKTLLAPCEVVIVNDNTTNPRTNELIEDFENRMSFKSIPVKVFDTTFGNHAKAQNLSMREATGEILIHIEDDIIVGSQNGSDIALAKGWNLVFSKYFEQYPEVGQLLPKGSGRGEWIPRDGYNEFMWGLGGLWAITKDVADKLNREGQIWDPFLKHQLEPDCNLRVRMLGYRLAELREFSMVHLGEGDQADTFDRQAQIIIGVHGMLKKWNERFNGYWDYDSLFSLSWDDFPPNVNFRRQLAAWYGAEARKLEDRCRGLGVLKNDPKYEEAVPKEVKVQYDRLQSCILNSNPREFQYPDHWGKFELIQRIRPKGREREEELITLMKNNFVFKGVDRLFIQLKDLAKRLNVSKTDDELRKLSETVSSRFWIQSEF